MAGALLLVGFALTAACGVLSGDGLLHMDDLTHFLYAKWSWQWPSYLLDEWGRPGFTALYALPAKFGWDACRFLSMILSAAAAWSGSSRRTIKVKMWISFITSPP